METLRQFKEPTSSWRENLFRVEPGETYTHHFDNTKPNMFYLQNPNSTKIHIGISKIPTNENYEFTCAENSNKTFGRPTATGTVTFFNDGNVAADLRLYSIADTFDLGILDSVSLNVEGITVDVEEVQKIGGFEPGVSLPSGDNTIGKIELGTVANETITQGVNGITLTNEKLTSLNQNTYSSLEQLRLIRTLLNGNNSETSLVKNIDDKMGSLVSALAGAEIDGVEGVGLIDCLYKETTENYKDFIENRTRSYVFNSVSINEINDLYLISNNSTNAKWEFNVTYTMNGQSANSDVTFNYVGAGIYELIIGGYSCGVNYEDYKGMLLINFSDVLRFFFTKGISRITITLNSSTNTNYGSYYFINDLSRKNITGILHDFHRIKDCKFAGTYEVGADTSTTVTNDYTSETNPLPIFNEIKKIYTTDDSKLKVKIFYTFADYYELVVGGGNVIEKIEHDVYAITFVNELDKTTDVCIIGGLY